MSTLTVDVIEAVFQFRDETSESAAGIRHSMTTLKADANIAGKAFAAAMSGVTTAFSAAALAAHDHERAMAAVASGTGATGAALDALQATASRVAGGLRGDFVGVAEATANLNTAVGLTGTDLEALSRHVAQAAIAMNDDLGAAADDVGQLMRAFGLEGAEAGVALTDHLVAAAQDTGGSMGQLAGQVLRLSPSLQSMGLNAEEAATFVGKLTQAGVPADRVLRSLKTTTAEWAEEGHDVRTMLGDTIAQVRDATTEQEAYRLSVDLFGSSAAPGMTQAIRSGVVPSLDDLAGALGDTSGKTTQVYEDTWTTVGALQELRNKATQVVGEILPNFGALASGLGAVGSATTGLAGLWPGAAAKIGGAAKLMWATMAGPVGWVIGALGSVGLAAWAFRDKLAAAFASVIDFVRPWVDELLGLISTAVGWIPGFGDELV